MHRLLLFTLVLCLSFTTISSIECYMGEDTQCALAPDMNNCGEGETCQCVKFLFQCRQGDEACTESEQKNKVKKWIYTVSAASACPSLKIQPSLYEQVTCCSKRGCNRPKNGKCSLSPARREALRKLRDSGDL